MKGWWGEKPNYLEYIGMEGGRGNEAQVCFQEWVQDKKWNYQRNLADDEDPSELEEPKTMLEQRRLEKERERISDGMNRIYTDCSEEIQTLWRRRGGTMSRVERRSKSGPTNRTD